MNTMYMYIFFFFHNTKKFYFSHYEYILFFTLQINVFFHITNIFYFSLEFGGCAPLGCYTDLVAWRRITYRKASIFCQKPLNPVTYVLYKICY